jgi:hypothetical protein
MGTGMTETGSTQWGKHNGVRRERRKEKGERRKEKGEKSA